MAYNTGHAARLADLKALAEKILNNIKTNYIKGLSVSGKTITYTKGDGTTGTITTQDTTYSTMTGATSSAAGKAGLVPAPAAGTQAKFLRGDGTWSVPTDTNTDTKVTNTLATTTKAYVTGTTSATTNTGTQVFDTGVYLDTTAGQLTATTFKGSLSGNATSATSATKATQDSDGNTINSTYLKLSGGAMTGNISYKGTKATYEMIKWIDNTSSTYGNGMSIGGGGLVIIGGGESANVVAATFSSGDSENLVLANDGAIDFYDTCQSGIDSATHTTISKGVFSGTAANANKLGGYSLSTAGTKDVWGTVPSIGVSDGGMEVGKYLDFHSTDGSTVDYDARIMASTSGLKLSGTTTGTFSGNLTGTATKATSDSAGNNINTTYIKAISASGSTLTYTKGNGTTGTVTIGTSALTGTITIPSASDSWSSDSSVYPYYTDIAISGVTTADRVDVSIVSTSLSVAQDCGLCSTTEAVANAVRIRSTTVPSADMTATYQVIKTS